MPSPLRSAPQALRRRLQARTMPHAPGTSRRDVTVSLPDGHTLTLVGSGDAPTILLRSVGHPDCAVAATASPNLRGMWSGMVDLGAHAPSGGGPWWVLVRNGPDETGVAFHAGTQWRDAPVWADRARMFNLQTLNGMLAISEVGVRPTSVLVGAHSGPGHLSATMRCTGGTIVAADITEHDGGLVLPARLYPVAGVGLTRISVPVSALLGSVGQARATLAVRVRLADGTTLGVRQGHEDLVGVRPGPAFSWTSARTPDGSPRRLRMYVTVAGNLGVVVDEGRPG